MNILNILIGAAIIIVLALVLSLLYKANGTDGSSLCSGDCSGCRKGGSCEIRSSGSDASSSGQ